MSIIKANGVSVRYTTGDFKDIGVKEYVLRHLNGKYKVKEFWADKDVSFELERGDMLGIIGTNGAGKSTLLKVVSGIMAPTEGWIRVDGTVAALLELTSGFDNELTVRENTISARRAAGLYSQLYERKIQRDHRLCLNWRNFKPDPSNSFPAV